MFYKDLNCLIHIIQPGDTLYSLSRKYNVPVPIIFRANPYVEIYNLQVGDELCIPTVQPIPVRDFTTYVVEEGDTLDSILNKFGIEFDELVQYNNLTGFEPQPGDVLYIPVYEQ